MEIIVQKFGGTSVGDLDRIRAVAEIVKSEIDLGNQVVAVVSAMAGVTNALITKCNEISELNSQENLREYDAALASGEIITSALLALQLQKIGLKAQSLQGWQVPLKTDGTHANAQIIDADPKRLRAMLDSGIIPVITGFQGVTSMGDVSTIGKGGSDTSAAIVAASIGALRCDIYTDVSGVYSADPRIVADAKKIDNINIDVLYALCESGAKVLHPKAAFTAKKFGFKLRVLSSFEPGDGTMIDPRILEKGKARAVTSNKNLLKIDIESSQDSIVEEFSKASIELVYVYDKTFIANLSDKYLCDKLLKDLKNKSLISKYSTSADISSVTIVGYGINKDTKLLMGIKKVLEENNIEIFHSSITNFKISFLINDSCNEKVIKILHDFCL